MLLANKSDTGMLGRTANDLFWLSRYVERAENMARLAEVGYRIVLLPREGDSSHEEWRMTLRSAGCADGYFAKHESPTTRNVIDYLLFDPDNPSSVYSCLASARHNARAQRTAMTREMWESLNGAWLDYSRIRPDAVTSNELPGILDFVKERSAQFRGSLMNTILRNDTYFFSQLGTFLERADNTARILDVKYYVLLPQIEMVGSKVDSVQWGSILRSVSAHRSYRWVYKENYKPWRVAEYVILNKQMPRSLHSSYCELRSALDELAKLYGARHDCHNTVEQVGERMREGNINEIFQSGLHEFLVDFIRTNNRLGTEISKAYHFVH